MAQSPPQKSWEETFLGNPQFREWVQAQFLVAPLREGQQLVDYVRERINHQAERRTQAVATQNQQTNARSPSPNSTPSPTAAQAGVLRQQQLQQQQNHAFAIQQQQLARAHAEAQARLLAASAPPPSAPAYELDEIFDMKAYSPNDPDPPSTSSSASDSPSSSIYSFRTQPQPLLQQQPTYIPPSASSSSSFSGTLPFHPNQQFASIDPSLVLTHPARPVYSALELQRQEIALQLASQGQARGQYNPAPNGATFVFPRAGGPTTSTTQLTAQPILSQPPPQPQPTQIRANPNPPLPTSTTHTRSRPAAVPLPTGGPTKRQKRNVSLDAPADAPSESGSSTPEPAPNGSKSTTPPPSHPAPPPPAPFTSPAQPGPVTAWQRGLPTLREHLTSPRMSRFASSSASKIAKHLSLFKVEPPALSAWGDSSDIPPEGRREVLEAFAKWGGTREGDFWKAWVGNSADGGMECLVAWLIGASAKVEPSKKGKGKEKPEESKAKEEVEKTLLLVMQIIATLPLTFDHLLKYKFAKRVKQISVSDKILNAEAKKIAKELAERWATWQMEKVAREKAIEAAAAANKRKAETSEGPKKKPKVEVRPAPKASAASTSAAATAAAAAKAKPKPSPGSAVAALFAVKTPLPSFKKEPKKPDAPFDPLAIGPPKPAGTKVDSNGGGVLVSNVAGKKRDAKEKKSVRWETEEKLEAIRFIESRLDDMDDDDDMGDHGIEAVRMMEEQEGQTLSLHLEDVMEEDIAWYDPIPLKILDPEGAFHSWLSPPESSEAEIQLERERTAIAFDPVGDDDLPSTPGEPPAYTAQDPPTTTIPLSTELREDPSVQQAIADAQAGAPMRGGFVAPAELSSLLGQLTGQGLLVQQLAQQQQQQQQNLMGPNGGFGQLQQSNYGNHPSFGAPPQQHHQAPPPADNGWGGNSWPQNTNYAAPQANNYQQNNNSNGYPGPGGGSGAQTSGRGVALKGKRRNIPCKFHNTPKGCDWGERYFSVARSRMRLRLSLLALLVPLLVASQDLPDDAADLPISRLLSLASTALSSGKSHSALSIYEHILERDPTDFATLYKRATVRLATGQLAKAKDGFRAVLEVREFDQAHLELARIHAKLGEYDEGVKEVDTYLKMHKGTTPKDIKEGTDAEVLRAQLVAAKVDYAAAHAALAKGELDVCVARSTAAIQLSSNNEALRLVRAECHLLKAEYDSAVGDLSRASALSPSLPPHLLLRVALLSSLFLDHGLAIEPDSLLPIKRCLSSDPDNKACRGLFKQLKATEKDLARVRNFVEAGSWSAAANVLAGSPASPGLVKSLQALVATYQVPTPALPADSPAVLPATPDLEKQSPLIGVLLSTLCRAYQSIGKTVKAQAVCDDVLARNPEDLWALVAKSDRLIAAEEWDEAVRILNSAFESTGRSDRMILEKLQKAQRLLKQSTAKDYYKVLGVSRDADAKTIKKAYRKATLKNHPDKEGGSEAKMAALNEAYEVISNPELRARFDNGEDPNEQQQGGGFQHGGSPFQHFFQQGGGQQQFFQQGGGQQYSFKFG
ncbi:hypothetical protein RQP46_011116 [Phenoliferia psychrophenolica]